MKKLLFVATLGVAGFMSANYSSVSEIKQTDAKVTYFGGWCEIRIYNGNGELIDYSYTYEQSESACRSRANNMLDEACAP